MHGHEHLDATKQTATEFKQNVEHCKEILKTHPRYVPFFACTWGRHNEATDSELKKMNLVPVLVNGTVNYKNIEYIDREAIDGKYESNI